MKKLSLLFILILPLVLTIIVSGNNSFPPEDFRYFCELKGPLKVNSLYQVPLPGRVLSKCTKEYDLRILDQEQNEIPYVILNNQLPEGIETQAFEIIGYQEEKNVMLVTAKALNFLPLNRITFEIPADNFQKNVTIYGSNDQKSWIRLVHDTIYDFSAQVVLRKTSISLQKVAYHFYCFQFSEAKPATLEQSVNLKYDGVDLRITKKNSNIKLTKIWGRMVFDEGLTTIYDEEKITRFDLKTDSNRDSVIIFKAGLPVDKINLNVANPIYYRDVEVFGSNTGNDSSYQLLTQGSVYRFTLNGVKETKDYIDCNIDPHKYYKLRIKNKNNPELQIKSITLTWLRKNLYFSPVSDSSGYRLYFGNDHLHKPEYDLANFIHQENWFENKYQNLVITEVQQNSAYHSQFFKVENIKFEKTVLIIVIIGLALGLIFWLWRLMKNIENLKT